MTFYLVQTFFPYFHLTGPQSQYTNYWKWWLGIYFEYLFWFSFSNWSRLLPETKPIDLFHIPSSNSLVQKSFIDFVVHRKVSHPRIKGFPLNKLSPSFQTVNVFHKCNNKNQNLRRCGHIISSFFQYFVVLSIYTIEVYQVEYFLSNISEK